jgi:hypothetical protein
MVKPVFTTKQIVAQLISADDGRPNYWGQKAFISYAIPDVAPPSANGESAGFLQMTSFMKSQTRLAFELWDDLIKGSLTEVSSREADITFAISTRTTGGPGAYTLPHGTNRGDHDIYSSADIWMHPSFFGGSEQGFAFGEHGFQTAIHEIGHALGLSHPGRYNGTADYARDAVYAQDTAQYSVMSYFKEGSDGSGVNYRGWEAQTPLLHDIMAIQALYGADMTTRTGDTTYGFNSNAGRAVFDFTANKAPIVCIWDAGGNDTLNLGGSAHAQTIDLREGHFSSVMGLKSNLSIAYGCVVENAVGGGGADIIVGNKANNALYGGQGADSFVFVKDGQGGNGRDLLVDFELGVDRILLDDGFFGTDAGRLTGQIKTQAQGWAYLEFSASDGVVFQGVTETALEQYLQSSFAFF